MYYINILYEVLVAIEHKLLLLSIAYYTGYCLILVFQTRIYSISQAMEINRDQFDYVSACSADKEYALRKH